MPSRRVNAKKRACKPPIVRTMCQICLLIKVTGGYQQPLANMPALLGVVATFVLTAHIWPLAIACWAAYHFCNNHIFFAVEGYVQSVYPGPVMRRGRGSCQSDVPHWRGKLPKRASDIQRVIRVSESFFAMLSALGSDAARR